MQKLKHIAPADAILKAEYRQVLREVDSVCKKKKKKP